MRCIFCKVQLVALVLCKAEALSAQCDTNYLALMAHFQSVTMAQYAILWHTMTIYGTVWHTLEHHDTLWNSFCTLHLAETTLILM